MIKYYVIYDGNCNLCVTFAQLLQKFDQLRLFDYIAMQDKSRLQQFGITPQACQMGMILIDAERPECRWQGSDAAEEIARLLPLGEAFVAAYRTLPGIKALGDRTYAQVRDNRYQWFGRRESTYYFSCASDCSKDRDRARSFPSEETHI